MANRPRNVDLGPLYLQVGEEADAQSPAPSDQGASAGDVSRFESLMRKGREHQQQGQQRELDALVDEALDPLRPQPQHGPERLAETDEIGAEIEHLWVGTGLRSGREVRVGLHDRLLPGTSVRLFDSEGRLRIQFTCDRAQVAGWLERKLAALAAELGSRLGREVEVELFMNDDHLVATCRSAGGMP